MRRAMPWTHGKTISEVVQGSLDSTHDADQARYARLAKVA
jgi:hypothetical protein